MNRNSRNAGNKKNEYRPNSHAAKRVPPHNRKRRRRRRQSSLLPALLFGVAVGNIYAGIPMDAAGNYSGIPLLGLITPFTLLCGLLGLAMFLVAGAAWIALKAPFGSELQKRAVNCRFVCQLAAIVVFLLVSVYGHFLIRPTMVADLTIVRFACAILFLLAMVGSVVFGRNADYDLHAFVCQAAAAVALVFLLATSMFPTWSWLRPAASVRPLLSPRLPRPIRRLGG
jgi:cytochrome d ubiquinol oxidase subunit II